MKSISGIKLRNPITEIDWRLQRGFVFNHSAVALRTENYCVQLYSLYADREVSHVQVIERNYQPGEQVTAAVVLVALSLDGSMMSTVEVKFAEEDVGGRFCLKFWNRRFEQKDFSLSTIIYESHRSSPIRIQSFGIKVWVHSQENQKKIKSFKASVGLVILLAHTRKSQWQLPAFQPMVLFWLLLQKLLLRYGIPRKMYLWR